MITRKLVSVLSVSLLAGALAACASKSDNDGVASVTGGGASPGGSAAEPDPGASLSDSERWLQFTHCLRDQGLQVQDPAVSGGLPGISNQTGDVGKRKAAVAACADYAPPGLHGGEMSAADKQKMLRYMGCLRSHGVPVLDPDSTTGLPQAADRQRFKKPDAAMAASEKACISQLPASLGGAA